MSNLREAKSLSSIFAELARDADSNRLTQDDLRRAIAYISESLEQPLIEVVTPYGKVDDCLDEDIIEDSELDRTSMVYISNEPLYVRLSNCPSIKLNVVCLVK